MFGIWNVGVCVGRNYTSHHPNPNYTVCGTLQMYHTIQTQTTMLAMHKVQ